MRSVATLTTVFAAGVVLAAGCDSKKGSPAPAGQAKRQTTCPVMGGEVDRTLHADHGGKRVYFCCAGCVEPFERDPEKYIGKLEAEGVELERTLSHSGASEGERESHVHE